MPMKKPAQEFHVGPRRPGALTILTVVFLLAALPGASACSRNGFPASMIEWEEARMEFLAAQKEK